MRNEEAIKRLTDKIRKRVESYTFDGGVLNDKPHMLAKFNSKSGPSDLKNFAGGPVSKITREKSGKTIGEVLVENMQRMNVNLLTAPFKNKRNSDILKFAHTYLKTVFSNKASDMRRVENLLQAVIRNPILRGDYGNNTAQTADAKGFDRLLIDTAQTFKAIRVKAKKNV